MVVVLQCIYMYYVTLNPPDDYDGCSVAMYSHALCHTETLRQLQIADCNAFTCIVQRCDPARNYERTKYLWTLEFTWRLVNKGFWIQYDDILV